MLARARPPVARPTRSIGDGRRALRLADEAAARFHEAGRGASADERVTRAWRAARR
jgi:hypothetical protein